MGRLTDYRQEEAVVHDRGGAGEVGAAQAGAAPLPAATAPLQAYLTVTLFAADTHVLLLSNMCFCLRFCGLYILIVKFCMRHSM